jgi:hypothetical protein
LVWSCRKIARAFELLISFNYQRLFVWLIGSLMIVEARRQAKSRRNPVSGQILLTGVAGAGGVVK